MVVGNFEETKSEQEQLGRGNLERFYNIVGTKTELTWILITLFSTNPSAKQIQDSKLNKQVEEEEKKKIPSWFLAG